MDVFLGRTCRKALAYVGPILVGVPVALILIMAYSAPAVMGANAATAVDAVSPAAGKSIFVVNSTGDAFDAICSVESCTLRAAILAANADPDKSEIHFNIPGNGPHIISVQSCLPNVTQELIIDGTTQPGYAGLPLIELDGSQPLDSGNGLNFMNNAHFSRVEGIAITGFRLEGIAILLVDHMMILNNHIGVGADGETGRGNQGSGIEILEGSHHSIRGNVIGANGRNGLVVEGSNARDNVIAGNYIGTNRQGLQLGNGRDGILARNSGPQIIGGTYGESGCCVGNHIAYNEANGVAVTAGFNASYEKGILGNRIYGNGGLGIDLQRDGVTENDPDDSDGDGLGNRLQNFPVLEAAHVAETIMITGTLTTQPETDFRLEFFANDVCHSTGHGQGQRYLGGDYFTSDGNGVVAFAIEFEEPFDPAVAGNFISATATDRDGNTSEFSACIEATGEASQGDILIYLPAIGRE